MQAASVLLQIEVPVAHNPYTNTACIHFLNKVVWLGLVCIPLITFVVLKDIDEFVEGRMQQTIVTI